MVPDRVPVVPQVRAAPLATDNAPLAPRYPPPDNPRPARRYPPRITTPRRAVILRRASAIGGPQSSGVTEVAWQAPMLGLAHSSCTFPAQIGPHLALGCNRSTLQFLDALAKPQHAP